MALFMETTSAFLPLQASCSLKPSKYMNRPALLLGRLMAELGLFDLRDIRVEGSTQELRRRIHETVFSSKLD